MKNSLIVRIQFYLEKEKFWLNAFAETGNQRFFRRAMKFKSKAEVLQSFRSQDLTDFSLKQINEFQNRCHILAERQLNLFEGGDFKLSNMNVI